MLSAAKRLARRAPARPKASTTTTRTTIPRPAAQASRRGLTSLAAPRRSPVKPARPGVTLANAFEGKVSSTFQASQNVIDRRPKRLKWMGRARPLGGKKVTYGPKRKRGLDR